jgi:hypothetical protein
LVILREGPCISQQIARVLTLGEGCYFNFVNKICWQANVATLGRAVINPSQSRFIIIWLL